MSQINASVETVIGATGLGGVSQNEAPFNNSALAIWANPLATSGRFNALRVESYANPPTASPAGIYAIRGVAGVLAGATVAGASATYYAGVQGKLVVQATGNLGNGSAGEIYACAVLAQVDAATGAYGSEVQVYGLWVDNQRPTNTEGLFHLVNVTNNGGTVDNVFFIYGNNAIADQVFNLNTMGTAVVAITGNATNQVKGIKVKLDGVQYYIPLQNATS